MNVRVLFVDDEPDVLEGLENRLHASRSPWRARFADSAAAALALLDAEPADVVVSDMRMPGMDGANLLEIIKRRHPATVRVILSGETGTRGFMRADAAAHQVLAKPCDLAALKLMVDDTLALQRRLHGANVVAAINRLSVLPTLPDISLGIEQALRNERSFMQELTQLLEQDPAIASRILRVANSAFFRGASVVTDLQAATARLGFDLIRGLVLSEELYARVPRGSPMHAALGIRREQALQAGYLAAAIAEPGHDLSLLFTAAVLHGIGAMQRICVPELATAEASDGELAGYVLSLWGLPFPLVEAVAYADQPSALPRPANHPALLLHLALMLRHRLASRERVAWKDQPGLDPRLLDDGVLSEAALDGFADAVADFVH